MSAKNTSKEAWAVVRTLCDESFNTQCNLSLNIDNVLVTSPIAIANHFGEYFVDEVLRLAGAPAVPPLPDEVEDGSFVLTHTSPYAVSEVICSLGSKKGWVLTRYRAVC